MLHNGSTYVCLVPIAENPNHVRAHVRVPPDESWAFRSPGTRRDVLRLVYAIWPDATVVPSLFVLNGEVSRLPSGLRSLKGRLRV